MSQPDVLATPERVVDSIRRLRAARPRDLIGLGIPHASLHRHLDRLLATGEVVRLRRGLYALADADWGKAPLADVAQRVPDGRICLLSALQFHGLTSQAPFEVWVAIHPKARRPKVEWPPVHIVRFSGAALLEGAERHRIDGVELLIYGPAKTVADCFKYRNKIGIDVALEALRSAWRERRVSMDDLWHYARVCRVGRVMRPYLESLA